MNPREKQPSPESMMHPDLRLYLTQGVPMTVDVAKELLSNGQKLENEMHFVGQVIEQSEVDDEKAYRLRVERVKNAAHSAFINENTLGFSKATVPKAVGSINGLHHSTGLHNARKSGNN